MGNKGGKFLLCGIAAAAGALPSPAENPLHEGEGSPKRYNVLLIIADDMRPEMGCYGVKGIRTPNLDALARQGIRFQRAYCNAPVSGASRASLLTGLYPMWPSRFTRYDSSASVDAPSAEPLSGCFTRGGYHTVSNGKVFHNFSDWESSWSERPWRVHPEGYGKDWAEYNKWEVWMNSYSENRLNPSTLRGPFCENADTTDEAYLDGRVAEKTISDLRRLSKGGEPFFIACGFWKPHLPFNAPKKYWDLYNRDSIPLAQNPFLPKGLPREVKAPTEVFSYGDVGTTDLTDEEFQRRAKHGYWACVSYVDAQVGKILSALDSLGLSDNTIVVFLGDHGWQLGEHTFWGKHTLMEAATRVPLIIKVPGMGSGVCESTVQLVDLYPTLCELCGVHLPESPLDGESLVPLLKDPSTGTDRDIYILWQGGEASADSRYNFAAWKGKGTPAPMMLYDHRKDPLENENVAGKRRNRRVVGKFLKTLDRIRPKESHKN